MVEKNLTVPNYVKADGTWTVANYNIVFGDDLGGVSPLQVISIYKGDINCDGIVEVADIATIISYMAGQVTGIARLQADVNDDGTVDVADIATVISIMAARARVAQSE